MIDPAPPPPLPTERPRDVLRIRPPPIVPELGPTGLQCTVFILALAVAIATTCYVRFNDFQRTHPTETHQ